MFVYSVLDTWLDNRRVSALYSSEKSAKIAKADIENEHAATYDWRYYNQHEVKTRFMLMVESVLD